MTAAPTIPASPADVTPEWLSSVLSTVDSAVVVRAVEVKPVGTGQTGATYRITATYADSRSQLPGTFIVKLPSQDQQVRQRVALGYRSEYAFYTEVADTVRLPIPRCFHIEIDNDGADFVMLLADLAPAERGLVESYHRALLALGVTGYDVDACWRDYRLGMLQVPLITTLGFAFSASTDRGDDMALAMLTRGCRAIRELGTLALIGESA